MSGSNAVEAHLGASSTAKQVIDAFGTGKYLQGKTAIVTGGNSGIGTETVKALASAGARVILCSRSIKAGEEAIANEIKQPGRGKYVVDETVCSNNILVKQLDLSSLPSIKSFADDFIANEENLDLLVLNAGIMALPKREVTAAGFEKQIGVNHFGHFYLTQLLRDKMMETAERKENSVGRIVVLSSTAHTFGKVEPTDLHFSQGRSYRPWVAYGQSKMANLLFAKSLGDKLKGTKLTAVSVHPGVIQTNLWRASFFNRLISGFIRDKSIPQGAATTVFACVAPRIETDWLRGAYLSDCGPAVPNREAQDEDGTLRELLWNATETQLAEALKK